MKCVKCGRDLPDGARFCGYCGTQQPMKDTREDKHPERGEVKYGRNQEPGAVPYKERQDYDNKGTQRKDRESGPVPVGPTMERDLPPAKGKKKGLIVAAAAIALVLLAAVGFMILKNPGKKDKESYLAYVKDGKLMEKDLNDLDKDPVILGDYKEEFRNKYRSACSLMTYSSDYKYLYYGQDIIGEEEAWELTYTLMRRKAHEESEPEIIAENVKKHSVYGEVVYYITDEGKLFMINEEDSRQISENAEDVPYYLKKDYMVFKENVEKNDDDIGETFDLCTIKNSFSAEKEILFSGISSYREQYSDKAEEGSILAVRDNVLYYKKWGKDPDRIVDNVTGEYTIDQKGTIFYVKKGDNNSLNFSDLVDDPYKEQDKTQPNILEDYTEWQAWSKRKNIRDSLKNQKPEDNLVLYSYRDGKETKISEYYNSYSLTAMKGDCIIYSSHDPSKMKKMTMDDLVSSNDYMWNIFNKEWDSTLTTWLSGGGKTRRLFDGEASYAMTDGKDKTGYVEKYGEDYKFKTLYSFDLSVDSSEEADILAENETDYRTRKSGIYYLTGMKDKEDCTLYLDGKTLDSGVNQMLYSGNENQLFYIKSDGSFCCHDGKEVINLAKGYYAYGWGKDCYYVLYDYNPSTQKGTLGLLDDNNELKIVDTDVFDFMDAGTFLN